MILESIGTTLLGPIVGAIGGLATQWFAYKSKALDLDDRAKARTHERDMMVWRHRNALEVMHAEAVAAERKIVLEGEVAATTADLANLGAAMASLPAWSGIQPDDSPGLRWFKTVVEAAQTMVRVVLTLFLGAALGYLTWHVWQLVVEIKPAALPDAAVQDLVVLVVRGFLEASTTAIMFWFSSRSTVLKQQRLGVSTKEGTA